MPECLLFGVRTMASVPAGAIAVFSDRAMSLTLLGVEADSTTLLLELPTDWFIKAALRASRDKGE
jgi:hypothetical protein